MDEGRPIQYSELMSDPLSTTTGARPLSLAEFEQLPEDEEGTELSRGWLVREPPPGGEHGVVCGEVYYLLRTFVSERNLGRVLIETGFRLSENPPTVRGPDIAFIAEAHMPAEVPIGYWTVSPDLAVDVVSPGNTPKDIGLKVLDYLDAGTSEIWVVQPRSRTVVVHRANGDARIVRTNESLSSELLPGLELPLSEIFRS
jgi:Uma2 family endonuclease